MKRWIREHFISAFYILAFLITWLAWVPQAAHSHGFFPFDSPIFYIVGGMGPMLAAFLVLQTVYGREANTRLFAPLFHWRFDPIWYLIALTGSGFLLLNAAALDADGIDPLRNLPITSGLLLFLQYLIAAIPEELAWRGFALPRLQSRTSALTASLITGSLWALWHLPLLWNQDNVMSTYPLPLFFIEVLAQSVIYSWLFNSTQGSVLITVLFHALGNTLGRILTAGFWQQTLVTVIAACLIVLFFGPEDLSHHPSPTADPDPGHLGTGHAVFRRR